MALEDFTIPYNGHEVTVQRDSETGQWVVPSGIAFALTPATLEGIRLQRESETEQEADKQAEAARKKIADEEPPVVIDEDAQAPEFAKPKRQARRAPKKDAE